MSDKQDQIDRLSEKLDNLVERQRQFITEINDLSRELISLKAEQPIINESSEYIETQKHSVAVDQQRDSYDQDYNYDQDHSTVERYEEPPLVKDAKPVSSFFDKVTENFNLEKFIGENLINKIGILITIIGVIIGAKYSIEHQLVKITIIIAPY